MNRPLALLGLALTLGLTSPAAADDSTDRNQEVPTAEDFAEFLEALRASNTETIHLNALEIEVTCVPDYFLFAVATELAQVQAPSKAFLVKKIKQLARKHKKSRGKVGIVLKFTAPSGPRDFYAMDGKLTDYIRVTKPGAGKARFKVVAQSGKVDRRKYSIFKPTRAHMWRGRNMSPTIKATWSCFSNEPYLVHLALTKDIDPSRVEELEVASGGFMHLSGRGISGNQIDFEKGAEGVREKIESVSFAIPLLTPAVPPAIEALLEQADDEANAGKK